MPLTSVYNVYVSVRYGNNSNRQDHEVATVPLVGLLTHTVLSQITKRDDELYWDGHQHSYKTILACREACN